MFVGFIGLLVCGLDLTNKQLLCKRDSICTDRYLRAQYYYRAKQRLARVGSYVSTNHQSAEGTQPIEDGHFIVYCLFFAAAVDHWV